MTTTTQGRRGWFARATTGLAVAALLAGSAAACDPAEADVAAPTTAPVERAEASPTPSAPETPTPSATPTPADEPDLPVTGTSPTATPEPAAPDTPAAPDALPGTALAAARELTVKGRAPKTGYARNNFGPAWADVDRNGCDTRNDVLARDLVDITTKAGTHDCVVLTGTLHDPYTGETIAFQRGQGTSTAVQIDHVVALSDAWQKGAQQWSADTRRQFANDPLNLMATKGSTNQSKGDGDTATWLPPNKAFRCEYVARQVAVKRAYGLWVTAAEQDAMVRVLSACPDQPLPDGGPPTPPAAAPPAESAPAAPAEPAAPPAAPEGDVYFKNCAAAWAAGAAPLHEGDPGYRAQLDGDKDGVACESKP